MTDALSDSQDHCSNRSRLPPPPALGSRPRLGDTGHRGQLGPCITPGTPEHRASHRCANNTNDRTRPQVPYRGPGRPAPPGCRGARQARALPLGAAKQAVPGSWLRLAGRQCFGYCGHSCWRGLLGSAQIRPARVLPSHEPLTATWSGVGTSSGQASSLDLALLRHTGATRPTLVWHQISDNAGSKVWCPFRA